eukprot:2105502-Amphidinium_carterae.1
MVSRSPPRIIARDTDLWVRLAKVSASAPGTCGAPGASSASQASSSRPRKETGLLESSETSHFTRNEGYSK